MNEIIKKILTTEEKTEFNQAIKEMLVRKIEEEIDDYRKNEWLFDTEYINSQIELMFDEVLQEVREDIKNKMTDMMMSKLEQMK